MRTLGYWLGCAYQLLTMLVPRLGWRQWQRWRWRLIHARDLGACLLAMGSLAALVWVLAL